MKTTYIHLILIAVLCLIPVAFMFANYRINLSKEAYDFERRIIYNFDQRIKLDLKYNTYYFAGNSTSSIYLGNSTAARHLLKVDTGLQQSEAIIIDPDPDSLTKNGLYRVHLNSSQYLFANGQTRSIFTGRVNYWNPKKLNNFIPYFKDVIPLSSGSKIYSYVSARTRENSLLKVFSNDSLVESDKIFQKQIDGLFCTSGTIGYNDTLQLLTYVYKFRNEIMLIDTNLRLIKKIKTIDPIDSARFDVSTIESTHRKVVTSPSLLVNSNAVNWKKYLFIQSRIMGKHEDPIRFKHSFVIDIYDLERCKYLYSLSIPNPGENAVNHIRIVNDYLFVLSENFIYRFKISLPGFANTDRLLKTVKT